MGDTWTGPRDGPFRGQHLIHCGQHRTIWFPQGEICPVCRLEQENRVLREEAVALRAAVREQRSITHEP